MDKKNNPIKFIGSLIKILKGKPHVPPSLADNRLLKIILDRRSVRSFTDQEIPDDIFHAILEAGRLAPSTVNLQTWTFACFNAATWRETFDHIIPFKAKRAVIIMADIHRGKQVLDVFPPSPLFQYTVGVMNASLAAMNMNIAAEALGVSSVMLSETGKSGLLDVGYLRDKLKLPEGVFPLTTIVFGYAKGAVPPMPPKLPLEQIICAGTYKEADRAVMEDWLAQTMAGFKASRPLSSFEKQIEVYNSRIGDAEKCLHEMVFPNESNKA